MQRELDLEGLTGVVFGVPRQVCELRHGVNNEHLRASAIAFFDGSRDNFLPTHVECLAPLKYDEIPTFREASSFQGLPKRGVALSSEEQVLR